MGSMREPDTGFERVLRAAVSAPRDGASPPADCPDAEILAAYAEQVLPAAERTIVEGHASTCPRCQAVLAVMVEDDGPEIAVRAARDLERPRAWRWWSGPALRWATPLAAAALGVILYVAVRPPVPGDTPMTVDERQRVARPEHTGLDVTAPEAAATTAGETEMADRPSLAASREIVQSQAAAPPAAAPVEAVPAAEARKAESVSADALRVEGKGAAVTRQKAVLPVEPRVILPEDSLDAYWRSSALVIRVRVRDSRPPVLVPGIALPGTPPVWEPLLITTCDVVEVFRRAASVAPTGTVSVTQVGGEVEGRDATYRVPASHWLPLQGGGDYVLFLVPAPREGFPDALTPVGGPLGIYRLDGGLVVRGHGGTPPPAPSAAEWLARLRQLAGTAGR